jgi:RNA recognition motif-containing protein
MVGACSGHNQEASHLPPKENLMNIHVGNLPVDLTERELRAAFEVFGKVESLEIISNIRTHEPLGYGFVVMEPEEAAIKAIESLNNTQLKGKAITVTKANRPGGKRRSSFKRPKGPFVPRSDVRGPRPG